MLSNEKDNYETGCPHFAGTGGNGILRTRRRKKHHNDSMDRDNQFSAPNDIYIRQEIPSFSQHHSP